MVKAEEYLSRHICPDAKICGRIPPLGARHEAAARCDAPRPSPAAVAGSWATMEPAAYDSSVDRSSPSVAQSASDVSGALTPRAAEISADVYQLIVREIPQLRADGRVMALLEASVGET
jgi:hypothetical protein